MISGRVKVKHGVEVAELREESVIFTDGSEIPADVVIFAYVCLLLHQSFILVGFNCRTGYQSIHHEFVRIFGKETIDRAGPIWGIDEEGEQRNVYRPTGHPAVNLTIPESSYLT